MSALKELGIQLPSFMFFKPLSCRHRSWRHARAGNLKRAFVASVNEKAIDSITINLKRNCYTGHASLCLVRDVAHRKPSSRTVNPRNRLLFEISLSQRAFASIAHYKIFAQTIESQKHTRLNVEGKYVGNYITFDKPFVFTSQKTLAGKRLSESVKDDRRGAWRLSKSCPMTFIHLAPGFPCRTPDCGKISPIWPGNRTSVTFPNQVLRHERKQAH